MKLLFTYFFVFLSCFNSLAQDMKYIKQSIHTLASPSFGGRGYVNNSRDKAARFLFRNFEEIGLSSFNDSFNFYQSYYFSVNTFPNKMELKLGKKILVPGVDFLVDARSAGFRTMGKMKVDHINLLKVKDSLEWIKLKSTFKVNEVYQFKFFDSLCKRLKRSPNQLVAELPRACFLISQNSKLIWTVATDTISATVFYIADTSLPKGRKVEVWVQNKFLPKALNQNVMGFIPGTQEPDSFFVFTAHYDHLGKMGSKAIFPGANDNASGTSFMLALAKYFQAHPSKYSIAFIAFSGEEAGLLGSKYFVENPIFPLAKIKFLVNIDLMGDASDGIMVVNAFKQKESFDLFQSINQKKNYLPKISSRDNAANSDHFPFTQVNVPAVFIYAMGGKGHYHDVFDKPKELSLNKIPEVFNLLTDFIKQKSLGQ
jgi:hypothetical protein